MAPSNHLSTAPSASKSKGQSTALERQLRSKIVTAAAPLSNGYSTMMEQSNPLATHPIVGTKTVLEASSTSGLVMGRQISTSLW